MKAQEFVGHVCALTFENTFNPYSQTCPVYDLEDAPARRTQALLASLEAALLADVDAIWIGRDLGYRGGRRTGHAFTDDVHMDAHLSRWGVNLARPTKGQVVAERTAAVIWSVLDRVSAPVFLWNVFPLHPHEPEQPFTNRAHNARERAVGEEILEALIELIEPHRIVAVGNDAARAARRVAANFEVHQVRHPSYGGQNEYCAQVRELYGVEPDAREQGRLL